MINKKKLHFYQLSILFSAIVFSTLLYNWGYIGSDKESESMMTESMGKMMRTMHLKNVKLSDLLKAENDKSSTNSSSASHHAETSSYKKDIYYISTAVILVLTPFIIAGSVFLAIVWIK